MSQSLCFVIPAHGRLALAAVCLRQLRRTCDELASRGIYASAVVIANDENLELAEDNNFARVERDNSQLGRKINDGYQCAGEAGFKYMAAMGSDDWLDPDWVTLPTAPNQIVCTRWSAVVCEDGRRLSRLVIGYPGGDGVRIYPRALLRRVGFRPADEDRKRAIDTSTHFGLADAAPVYAYHDTHPLAIVDWKSRENLNDYAGCRAQFGRRWRESDDPFGELAAVFPADAISEMRGLYDRELVIA